MTKPLQICSFQLDDTTKEEVTGTQLLRRCNKLARSLFAAGIRPGDAVAICCDSELDLCYVMIACFLLGAAFVPLAVTYADRNCLPIQCLYIRNCHTNFTQI